MNILNPFENSNFNNFFNFFISKISEDKLIIFNKNKIRCIESNTNEFNLIKHIIFGDLEIINVGDDRSSYSNRFPNFLYDEKFIYYFNSRNLIIKKLENGFSLIKDNTMNSFENEEGEEVGEIEFFSSNSNNFDAYNNNFLIYNFDENLNLNTNIFDKNLFYKIFENENFTEIENIHIQILGVKNFNNKFFIFLNIEGILSVYYENKLILLKSSNDNFLISEVGNPNFNIFNDGLNFYLYSIQDGILVKIENFENLGLDDYYTIPSLDYIEFKDNKYNIINGAKSQNSSGFEPVLPAPVLPAPTR